MLIRILFTENDAQSSLNRQTLVVCLFIDPDKEFYEPKIVMIFLPINLNMCFGCSKEPSHGDGSLEYPQHMFWMRNKENKFPISTHLEVWFIALL